MEAKKRLLQRLLGDKIGDPAMAVLNTAAAVRWSQTSDLVDGVEHVARLSLLVRAERDDQPTRSRSSCSGSVASSTSARS